MLLYLNFFSIITSDDECVKNLHIKLQNATKNSMTSKKNGTLCAQLNNTKKYKAEYVCKKYDKGDAFSVKSEEIEMVMSGVT